MTCQHAILLEKLRNNAAAGSVGRKRHCHIVRKTTSPADLWCWLRCIAKDGDQQVETDARRSEEAEGVDCQRADFTQIGLIESIVEDP